MGPLIDELPFNASLVGLWGPKASKVTIKDLLGMSSGFGDYNDEHIQKWTFHHRGDDMGPFAYLVSAARSGLVCEPGSCHMYSGANYVLLGLVLVQLADRFSWQDFDQFTVFPPNLWKTGNYHNLSFAKLGRCLQYQGVSHQYAIYKDPRQKFPKIIIDDLLSASV